MKQPAGQLSPSTKLPSSHVSAGPSTIAFPQHPCPAGQSAASRHCVPLPVHRPMAWQFELQSEAQRFPTGQFAVPLSQVSPKSLVPSPQHPKVGQSSGWFVGSQFGVGRRSRGQSFVDVHAGPVAWLVASKQRPEPLTVDVVVVDVVVVVASVVDVLGVDVEVVVGNVVDDRVVVDVVVVASVVDVLGVDVEVVVGNVVDDGVVVDVVVVASVVDVLGVDVVVVVGGGVGGRVVVDVVVVASVVDVEVVDDGVVVDVVVVVVARVVVVVVGPTLVVVVVVVLVVVVEPGRRVVVVVVGRITVVVVVVGAGHTKICPSMASSCVRSASRKADCAPAARQGGQPPVPVS